MANSLLATKLFIPHTRPELVPRPRLVEQLNKGLHRKLTLISAPAGFGKTTLITEWLDDMRLDAKEAKQIKNKIAWLSLDEGDNDSARFLSYFITALNQIEGIGVTLGEEALSMLQSPQPPPIETILTPLINEIAIIPDRIIFVLDDYHVIESSHVDDILAFFLENLPPNFHLVFVTREDPHLSLSRFRASGQLSEFRVADLGFTSREAAEFLNQTMGLNLSDEDIILLESRTEGWIAGLQLAAISLQGQEDVTAFIKSFSGSHRLVLDYLIEEVLEQQPEDVQSFLLQTSILDRLNGPLCDALTGQANGQMTLEILEHKNLFIVPLDGERQWYRYHHLFANLLLQRLKQTQQQQLNSLRRKASKWYEMNGVTNKAIEFAVQSEDFERAAGLIELAWPAMDESFQLATWLGWVKWLPDELVRARPVLSLGYGWALLNSSQFEAAEARLIDVEQWLEPTDDFSERGEESLNKMVITDEKQFRSLPISLASARAYHAQALGDVPGTVKYAQRALNLTPKEDHFARGRAAVLLGLALWTKGDLEDAHLSFADAMASFQIAGNILFAISFTFILADISILQGRLHEAIRTYEQSLQLAREQVDPLLQGNEEMHAGLSELHCEQGDLETAKKHLLSTGELGEVGEQYRYRWYLAQARLKEALGELDASLDLLQEAESIYQKSPIPDVRPVSALKTRIWLKQGRLVEALDWARERGLSVDNDLSYLREFEHITLARVLIAQYKSDLIDGSIHQVKGFVELLLQAAEEGGRMGSVIEILVLQALIHEVLGEISPALVSLERALSLAESEYYVRIFVDEGPPMKILLNEALSCGISIDYVRKLLAAFTDSGLGQEDPGKKQVAGSELVELLSNRELDILQLMAEGHKYQKVAEQLVISLNTVRYHTKNIYSKLGVNNRAQAIKKANDLNLL